MSAGLSVRTRGLVHIYRAEGHDVAALSGVDLDVAAGELVGLLGPSGSGKSTLVSVLCGLFRPSAGKVFVGDTELGTAPVRRLDDLLAHEVSVMLQGATRNLLPYLDAEDNVAFAQRVARTAGRPVTTPRALLDAVGLADHARAGVRDLVPGQQQLLAVAVAMASGPGLLVADEPTSQLDHRSRDTVLDALTEANRRLGTTVVLVTHDPDVVRRLPRTVTIRDGRIGGEGRRGEEYAVVTVDGFLPLPAGIRERLPPGTLVRVVDGEDGVRLEPQEDA